MADPDQLQRPSSAALSNERRRPGRLQHASPELIPLLRGECTGPPVDPLPAEDDLAAARGVASGLLIGVALWAALGLAVWGLLSL